MQQLKDNLVKTRGRKFIVLNYFGHRAFAQTPLLMPSFACPSDLQDVANFSQLVNHAQHHAANCMRKSISCKNIFQSLLIFSHTVNF
jgi:hypothetical protein